jgi:hypothetical protein
VWEIRGAVGSAVEPMGTFWPRFPVNSGATVSRAGILQQNRGTER